MPRRLPRLVALSTTGLLFVGGVAAAATATNVLSPSLGANRDAPPLVTTTTTLGAFDTSPTAEADDGDALTPEEICAAAKNHGEMVSGVAHDKSTVGAEHGAAVSEMAKSDCGKKDDEAVELEIEATDDDDDDEDLTLEEFCASVKNHGQAVSKVAKDKSNVGAAHGAAVSEMAKSDCGKKHDDDTAPAQGS